MKHIFKCKEDTKCINIFDKYFGTWSKHKKDKSRSYGHAPRGGGLGRVGEETSYEWSPICCFKGMSNIGLNPQATIYLINYLNVFSVFYITLIYIFLLLQ